MRSEDKDRVLDRLNTLLAEVEGVTFAYVHGSFVHRDQFRDLDLAVWVEEAEQAFHYTVEVSVNLEAELEVPVDLHVLNQAPLPFRYQVYTTGRLVLTKDEELRLSEVNEVLRRYFDWQILKQKEKPQA